MQYLEAKQILKFHSGWSEENEEIKDSISLIASLRPFQGEIIEETNFLEIKEAIFTVYLKFNGQTTIDREIIKYINSLIGGVNNLAIRERSPLRRNNLISEAQLNVLKKWITHYEQMVHYLLLDLDPIENMKDGI